LTILTTGDPAIDEAFNYFFSLMVCMGALLIIPAAILGAIRQSLRS